jgi:hypothetical protein
MRPFDILRPAALAASAFAALCAASAAPAAAQSSECDRLSKVFEARAKTMQQIEGFRKKAPSADQACAVFGRLKEQNATAMAEVERNGDWCHVPPDILPNLKAQHEQIEGTRKSACTAAAQQRKQAEDAKKQGLLGGGDIIGGPMRLPQGAL